MDPRICISAKFPGAAAAAGGPGTTLGASLHEATPTLSKPTSGRINT